jgi:hypothetical protein
MSKRQEDFFNEATKQVRDSYVFQNEETYSDNDVRDIAVSLAEHGYQYATDKIEKWLSKHAKKYVCVICDGNATSVTYEDENLIKDLRKAMQ